MKNRVWFCVYLRLIQPVLTLYAHATPYTQSRHFFVANTSSYRLASGGCTLLRAVAYHCSGPCSIYCPAVDRAESPLWCAREAHGTGRLIDPCFYAGFFFLSFHFVFVFSFFRVCCQAKTKKGPPKRLSTAPKRANTTILSYSDFCCNFVFCTICKTT